jgi:hypothetical protein
MSAGIAKNPAAAMHVDDDREQAGSSARLNDANAYLSRAAGSRTIVLIGPPLPMAEAACGAIAAPRTRGHLLAY